jgi:predicted CXXCH cytochrome family protein
MKAANPNRFFVHLIMVIVLIAIVSGCDKHGRHKVLTVLFTGVPPLEEDNKGETEKNNASKVQEEAKQNAPKVIVYTHPLSAARLCDQCHLTKANFAMFGRKVSVNFFQKGMPSPGKLVVPRKELCIKCHKDKSDAKALREGIWLHTTAAKGDCNKCHDPHQSNHQYLLLETPRQICIPCHKDPKIMELAAHKEPGECLTCHNPHLGKDRKLLTKDYKEVKQPVSPLPGLPGFPAVPDNLPAGVGGSAIKTE